jgi:putative transposon-encoded protein
MPKVRTTAKSELKLKNIKGFIEKTVTAFGTGAKVDFQFWGLPRSLLRQL